MGRLSAQGPVRQSGATVRAGCQALFFWERHREIRPMNETERDPIPSQPRDEPPPLLGTWRRLYLVVIGWLLFLILIFYLFARRYAP